MAIRVMIIHPALPPYRLQLFNALAERFQLRLVFLLDNLLDQKFDQMQLRSRLKADHVYLTNGIILMKRIFRFGIKHEITRFKPNVVVTTEFSPATLAVILYRLFSKITFRHVVWTDDNQESIKRDMVIRGLMRRLVLYRIDGLICLSNEAAKMYQDQFNAAIPIGISPILHEETYFQSQLYQALPIARILAEKYKLEGKRIVLYVGRLAPEKRVDRILHAFVQIKAIMADVSLVIVGDGPELDKLTGLAKTLRVDKATIFTGRLEGPSLYAWYGLGGLFVLASEFEPFGAVVNEALLAGMPVVCSHCAGARVLIKEGVNGTVVNASDPAKLQTAILTWLLRIPPLAVSHNDQFRPSLMTTSFQESVDGFLTLIAKVMRGKNKVP